MKNYRTKQFVKAAGMGLLLAAVLAAAGCYEERPRRVYVVEQQPPPVVVEQQPPPTVYYPPPGTEVVTVVPAPQYDPMPPQPGPDYIWIQGSWIRSGGNWVWVRGRWDRAPRPGMRYEPDHWQPVRGGYVHVQGGWR